MRVLFDTNLLVRAAITPDGLARRLLRRIEREEDHVLIVSSHLLTEVADVLRRPRIRARWPLSDEDIGTYCRHLASVAREVSIQPSAPAISDPKDQAIVEAAVAGKADVICTSDFHFYQSPAKEFLAERGISVLSDKALLLLLESQAAK
jgi:putative PIN family toxin of toxin-antitoxin system